MTRIAIGIEPLGKELAATVTEGASRVLKLGESGCGQFSSSTH